MKRFVILFVSIALLVPAGCGKKTEEERIHELLSTLIRLAEKKDLMTMMTHFADDFTDFEGRTKSGIESLLGSYFSGRTGIVAHELGTRVENVDAAGAVVQTEVALSSGGAEALRRLIKISPDNYRIRVELIRSDDRWLIQYAEWAPISLTQLFPESLVSFEKLFPGLRR